MARIVFLDNFDSFTYNLVDEFLKLKHTVLVYQNTTPLDILLVETQNPNTILVLSPGPGNPQSSGNLLQLIHATKEHTPILGICLGHQALIEAFGGQVVLAGEVLHGKISLIDHDDQAMFAGIANPMPVARYHSLMGTQLSNDWVINARAGDIIMAIRHRQLPICAYQFHPESIMTVQGSQLLKQSLDWLLTPKPKIKEVV